MMNHNRNDILPHFEKRKGSNRHKVYVLFLSLLLIIAGTVGGSLAVLTMITAPKNNTFMPSNVTCEVTEHFDGMTKSSVNVTNTGDTDAYIRVKLVSYRINEAGQHIGGVAEVPSFTPGADWIKNGEYYYYTYPVKPGGKASSDLIRSISLTGAYADADGGKQVLEVMAEAIQSKGDDVNGTKAVVKAWGVDPETFR